MALARRLLDRVKLILRVEIKRDGQADMYRILATAKLSSDVGLRPEETRSDSLERRIVPMALDIITPQKISSSPAADVSSALEAKAFL